MAATLLPSGLWDLVEPFLPIPPRRPKGGRPRVSDRACLTGILFVLRSGIPWQMLPREPVRLTGANRNDSQEALALVDAIPQLQCERGRPRRRPDCVFGDRGYDGEAIRRGLRARHIVPWLAMRPTAVASAGSGGSSSVRFRGSISFATCACGMTSGLTSTRRSSRWAAR
jgi:transposase